MVEDTAPPILGQARKVSIDNITSTANKPVKVSYLTEQTSHHPPVSAFFVNCPEKGITARGFDQLSAKFTGTGIRVTPGAHNLGIFVNVQTRDNEEYQLTHPAATLGGLIRGSPSVTVADTCFVTCPKTRIKVILQYLEEGWLGKTQNKVLGVVYRYEPGSDKCTRIKDVPDREILAKIDGCWYDRVYYTLAGSKVIYTSSTKRPPAHQLPQTNFVETTQEPHLLVDLNPLFPVPKIIPPEVDQLPNESRRFWADVTQAILDKQFAAATKLKTELEERQREKAGARKAQNEEWIPRFFTGSVTPVGKPELTNDGVLALRGLHEGDYRLPESVVMGA